MKELDHPNITASISSTNNAENPIISMGKPSAKKYTSYSMKNTTLVVYLNCLFVYGGFVWFFSPSNSTTHVAAGVVSVKNNRLVQLLSQSARKSFPPAKPHGGNTPATGQIKRGGCNRARLSWERGTPSLAPVTCSSGWQLCLARGNEEREKSCCT